MTYINKLWVMSGLFLLLALSFTLFTAVLWLEGVFIIALLLVGAVVGIMIEVPFTRMGFISSFFLGELVILIIGSLAVLFSEMIDIKLLLHIGILGASFFLSLGTFWYLSDVPKYRQVA